MTKVTSCVDQYVPENVVHNKNVSRIVLLQTSISHNDLKNQISCDKMFPNAQS